MYRAPSAQSELEARRSKNIELAEGRGARAQEERFFRGELTPTEMANRARLRAGQQEPEGPRRAAAPIEFTVQNGKKVFLPRTGEDVTITRKPFNEISPETTKEAILEQLQARKARARAGVIERIAQDNQIADNIRRGLVNTDPQAMIGARNVARTPNVVDLGKARLGAQRFEQGGEYGPARAYYQGGSDMGLRIGDQNVTLEDAIPVRRPDGSIEWFDGTKMAMLGDSKAPAPVQQVATSAGNINAPISGESAEMFVERNLYDNYGAQFFGDDAIIGNMEAKGSGGGIPQVEITGTLNNLEQLVAKRLGVEPKGIRSIASLQAASDAVIADAKAKGRVLFTMDGGKKVFSENPGLQEVMWDLKIPPAQQKEVANALYQLEASRRQDVNLDSKESFFSGGRATQPAMDGRTIGIGLDDPAKGGDRLDIKKDVGFVNKAIARGAQGDVCSSLRWSTRRCTDCNPKQHPGLQGNEPDRGS